MEGVPVYKAMIRQDFRVRGAIGGGEGGRRRRRLDARHVTRHGCRFQAEPRLIHCLMFRLLDWYLHWFSMVSRMSYHRQVAGMEHGPGNSNMIVLSIGQAESMNSDRDD
jgi:hypothetical protein